MKRPWKVSATEEEERRGMGSTQMSGPTVSEAGNVFLLIGRRAQCLGWVDYQNHEIRERKKNTALRGGKAPSVGYLMPEDITRSMLDKVGKSLGSKVLYNQKIGTTSADRRLLILKPSVEVENAAVITAHSRNS